jgi:ParB family transcriptional regulator, chromosome partitioning protein
MSKNKLEFGAGKGIKAMFREMEENDTANNMPSQEVVKVLAGNIAMIPVEIVEINPFQPRKDFDADALRELSESVKNFGLIQPITVRRLSSNQYQLISGERRLRASKLAGLLEIPAYIRLAANDTEMLEMALVENIQRAELNPIEVAISYQRLIDECKLTHESLATRVAKNRATVTNALRLLKLPPEIQNALKQGYLTTGHAKALAGIEDIAFQLMLFRQITAQNLSVRETESMIQKYNSENANRKAAKPAAEKLSPEYRRVQDAFSSFFGSKTQLKRTADGKGQIVIGFNSDEELNKFLELLED